MSLRLEAKEVCRAISVSRAAAALMLPSACRRRDTARASSGEGRWGWDGGCGVGDPSASWDAAPSRNDTLAPSHQEAI